MASSGRRKRRTPRRKKRANTRSQRWQPALWIAAAAICVIAALWWVQRAQRGPAPGELAGVEDEIRSAAARHGVPPDRLAADTEIRKLGGVFVRTWRLGFPTIAAREEFIAEMEILGDRKDVTVAEPVDLVGRGLGVRVDHGIEAFDLQLTVIPSDRASIDPGTRTPPRTAVPAESTSRTRPTPGPDARGRLAILLDDAGQSMELVSRATRLPAEVGIAILPFLPYSVETAVEMHDAGHEVWLHLPMEAVGGEDPGPGALMVEMSDDELRDTVHMAINNLPNVVGVNNHMGSKATANLGMMTRVMQELAAMDLAFIDSRTTVDTVAEEAARSRGVATGRRHVFLDNERSEDAIKLQLDEAVDRARTEGDIIAIGHLNEVTLNVLSRELPRLEDRGADLVPPLELLN